MALIKHMVLDDGIEVSYHRIVSIISIINKSNIIEIASYTSKNKRAEEKEASKKDNVMNVFIHPSHEILSYDKKLDVDSAYEYLKTLDKFKDSENDME